MFFQQDGATSHTSLETGNYCNRHFPIMWFRGSVTLNGLLVPQT
jgi:hypothetical protein